MAETEPESGEGQSGVRSADVRHELARILTSTAFEASERNRRFLRYVVDETLAGRADRIKAYAIATRVFGRGDDFDPMLDSIVRIEAGRLRRALELVYLKQGGESGLRIHIPKGTYVPEFRAAPPETEVSVLPGEAPSTQPLHGLGPRIMVETFDQDGALEQCPNVGRTLTRQVVSALTRFTDLFVYGFDTSDTLGALGERPGRTIDLAIDYRLVGAVTVSREALHVDVLMKRAEDGRFVWADTVSRDLGSGFEPGRIVGLCAEIAGHVARVMALRDGVIDSQAREAAGDAPRHFAGYQKLLDFQDYWRSLDPRRFEPLRRDLEATIAEDPRFASGFACLSILYSDAARYGYAVPGLHDAPLDRALDLARTAIHLAPQSSRAHHARAIAEWFSGRPEASIETLRIARSLNPNDPELMAELGFRNAMRMEWDSAVPQIEEAYLRNPLQSGQYRMGLFLYHFANGRHETALRLTGEIATPGLSLIHLAAAAALSAAGRIDEARHRLHQAEMLFPTLRLNLRQDLAFRQLHPELIEMIVGAIEAIDSRKGPAARRTRAPRA